MVEKEKTPNDISELTSNELAEVLVCGYDQDIPTAIMNMVKCGILIPGVYRNKRKVFSPNDILKAAYALELNKSGFTWSQAAEYMGSSTVTNEGKQIRASREWMAIIDCALDLGVKIDTYPKLTPINRETLEVPPLSSLRPQTDLLIECPSNHPILARFPHKLNFAHFYASPWHFSEEILIGETPVESDGLDVLTCPHCPNKVQFEVDIDEMWNTILIKRKELKMK